MPAGREMKHPRRLARGLAALLAAALCGAYILPAAAEYPERNVTLVVPFAAGGGTDTIARIVGEYMTKRLGRSVVVENVAGAGGTTASTRVAQAAADGYTILIGHMGTHGAAPTLHPNLKYDPRSSFTFIGQTAGHPVVIVTKKDFPANSLAEFMAYLRENGDKVTEAHAGVGSASYANCMLLQQMIGARTGRVAYRGIGPAVNDLVGGQVDFSCLALSSVASQINAGTLKAMAVATPERVPMVKDVPTTREAGLPGFQLSFWNAFFAPPNLPPGIQATLTAIAADALDDEVTRKRLLDVGCILPARAERTPEALAGLVTAEVALWARVLGPSKAAN